MMKPTNSHTKKVEVVISNQTVVRLILSIFAIFLTFLAVRQAMHALTLIFVAFFLALALNAPVHWIASRLPGKRKGSRTLATAVSFLFVVVVLGMFTASVLPPLVKQTGSMIDAIPTLIDDLHNSDTTPGRFVKRYGLESRVDSLSEQSSKITSTVTGNAFSTVGRIGGGIVSILTVLVMTYMMLIEGPRWLNFVRRILPDENKAQAETLGRSMYRVIKGYVNGQVMLAFIASILLLPVFVILGVSYPFALVFVVFICGLIPMIGHTIGAIIVTLVALFTSLWSAVFVLVFYILYQQIENYAVQPKIQANTTDMSPLLVFASVVVGVSFSGILGGLLAIPVAGCLKILLLEYMYRKGIITRSEAPELEVVSHRNLPKTTRIG